MLRTPIENAETHQVLLVGVGSRRLGHLLRLSKVGRGELPVLLVVTKTRGAPSIAAMII